MNPFAKKNPTPSVVVIGCNRVGIALSTELSAQGYTSTIIDNSSCTFESIPLTYLGNTLLGDATDDQVIEEINYKDAHSIFVVTSSDILNIFIVQILRQKQGNQLKIISRLNDLSKANIYKMFDIKTISVESNFASEIIRGMKSAAEGDQK